MASLELKNVVKRYKSQTVLDNLSLSVADGETLVLFGPSGAGKTVLLRMIAGVIDPDEGKILIGGEDMTDVDAEFRGVAMLSKALICGNSAKFWNAMPTPLEARHSSQGAIKS
ncbi:ATP-binding cassette domain-containing protein, partial [Mesorhizobium sp. M4B.F.Ca.ET.049.02.1.2]|uniref:ATP-binding cassette domain-containing protein n=1 Tax=Mesorhizobium sp. M4B.F.Ca.ET.049.02.1.2 TaxID=2496752 RepID=UPI00167B9E33